MTHPLKLFSGAAVISLAACLGACGGSNDDSAAASDGGSPAPMAANGSGESAGMASESTADESMTASAKQASAMLKAADGTDIGTLHFQQTPNGVLITGDLSNLPPGAHGFHIHEHGACMPDFAAAGGHFAPKGHKHGFMVDGGPHAGDMPNIHVGDDGRTTVEAFNPNISLKQGDDGYLFDEDGSALIVHQGSDDYMSQPSGNAGDRIACGVIKKG